MILYLGVKTRLISQDIEEEFMALISGIPAHQMATISISSMFYPRTIDDINQHARYKEKKAFPCVNCPKSYSSQYRLNDHKKVCSGASSVLSNNTVKQNMIFYYLESSKEFFLQDPAFINEVVAYAMETTVLTAARAYKVIWTHDVVICLYFLIFGSEGFSFDLFLLAGIKHHHPQLDTKSGKFRA